VRAGGCGSIVEVLEVLKEGGGEQLQPGILFQQLESRSIQVLQYTSENILVHESCFVNPDPDPVDL
jgi:hypothetical protein